MTGEPDEAGRDTSAEVAVYIQRADLLDDLGHHAEAAQELRDALALQPGNPEALATLAMVQLRAGRAAQALDSARAALTSAPDHLLGQVVRGYVLAELGRKSDTLSAAEQMLAVDRRSWLRQLHYASIVRRVRNGQATLDAAWTAVQLAPDEPETHLVLAAVAGDLGLADVAGRARAEALRLDPRAGDPVPSGSGPSPGLRLRAGRTSGALPDDIIEDPPSAQPRRGIRSGVSRFLALGALYAWGSPLLVAGTMLLGDTAARVVAAVAAAAGVLLFGTFRARMPDGPEPLLRVLGRLDRLLAAGCVSVLAAPAMLLVFTTTGWAWPLGGLILLGAFAFAALAVRATDIPRSGHD